MGEVEAGWHPPPTMPEAEAALVAEEYGRARVILEYGSGASTVLAAGLPGKVVTSVESDGAWAGRMEAMFAADPPASPVSLHWVDIGPTKAWGHPRTDSGWRNYAAYPLAVWDSAGFEPPDVVLIDGRFRIGCLLATLYRSTRPVVVLFDDYTAPRRSYRAVERFVGPPRILGRMARFDLTPAPLRPEDLLAVIELMQAPQ